MPQAVGHKDSAQVNFDHVINIPFQYSTLFQRFELHSVCETMHVWPGDP
jgi:hypothetical protein